MLRPSRCDYRAQSRMDSGSFFLRSKECVEEMRRPLTRFRDDLSRPRWLVSHCAADSVEPPAVCNRRKAASVPETRPTPRRDPYPQR